MRLLAGVCTELLGKLQAQSCVGLPKLTGCAMIFSFSRAVKDWARLVRDLGRIFLPPLLIAAIPAALLATTYSRSLLF